MKVYFVRHGESELNAKGIHQPSDSKLSSNGIRQAEFVAQRLTDIPLDVIVSSPFDRAKQTAEIIAKDQNKPLTLTELFIERKRPSEIENKHAIDPNVLEIKSLIKTNYHTPDWKYSDEENFEDVKKRATEAVKYLKNKKVKIYW